MLVDTKNLIQWTDPADAAFTIIGVAEGTNHTTIDSFGTAIKLLKPLDLSVWLTGQRPALDASGHVIGFASDTGQLELWNGVQWSQITTSFGGTLSGPLHMGANLLDGSNVSFTGGTLAGLTFSGNQLGTLNLTGAGTALSVTNNATIGGTTITTAGGVTSPAVASQGTLTGGSTSTVKVQIVGGASQAFVQSSGGPLTLAAPSNSNINVSPAGTGLFVVNQGMTANLFTNGTPTLAGNFAVGTNLIVGADSNITPASSGTYWLQAAGNVGQIAWTANTAVTLNTKRNNGGNIYIVTTAGTTAGSGGPTGTGTGIIDGTVVWNYVSSDFVGPRSALALSLNVRSMNGPATSGDLDRNWPTMIVTFQASANQGGTSPVGGSSAGNGYSGGDQSWLFSGATNWSSIAGREIDVGIFTGATAKSRIGLNLVSFGDLPANVDDQAIAIQGRTVGFKTLIRIGEVAMTATDAILQYFPRPQGTLNGTTYANPVVDRGIDLANIPFTTAAFRAPGNGGIDGNGYIFSGAAKLSTSTTAVSLDAPGSIVQSVDSFAAGTLFKAEDQLYDPAGTGLIVTVNTVNGSGVPLTWTMTQAGGVLASTPANPVTLSGGSGIGSSVNLTWVRVSKLSLNKSGGNTIVGTGSDLAVAATTGFLIIPSIAGSPTGAAPDGAVVRQSGTAKLWMRDAGAWKSILLT